MADAAAEGVTEHEEHDDGDCVGDAERGRRALHEQEGDHDGKRGEEDEQEDAECADPVFFAQPNSSFKNSSFAYIQLFLRAFATASEREWTCSFS